jgi:hypothetical protein
MGQMKRIAMLKEDEFYEIAQEYLYIAETWAEYRDHMRNQKDLVVHLKYNEVEDDLKDAWNDYQQGYYEENLE